MRYIPLFMKKVIWALQYMKIIVKHKWFVLIIGWKLDVPLYRLLKHDLSKFKWIEIWGYGRQFCGDQSDPLGFAEAWLHHQNVNDHHWEYWIPRSAHTRGDFHDNAPMLMPESAMMEMLADWFAAGRTYRGRWPDPRMWNWYNEHFHKMHLNMSTRAKIEGIIVRMKHNSKWWPAREILKGQ